MMKLNATIFLCKEKNGRKLLVALHVQGQSCFCWKWKGFFLLPSNAVGVAVIKVMKASVDVGRPSLLLGETLHNLKRPSHYLLQFYWT